MKKSAIYFRISTSKQDETSQLEDLKRWAKSNDYDVGENDVFGEAKSGYDPNVEREELDKLKSYVVENKIQTVLVWDLSRLGRSTLQTLQHIEFFTENKINVIFKKEGLETLEGSFTNKLVINLLSSMAEMERNTIMERTTIGRIQSAQKGKIMGYSSLPLGYDRDENGYLILNEKEVPLVKEIYLKASSGISTNKIAQDLNSRGIPTHSAKLGKRVIKKNGKTYDVLWNSKTIKNIIRSTRNKGYRNYTGQTIPTPRIIEDDLWKDANRKIDEKIGYITRTKHDYLVAGKVACGYCKYTLRVRRKQINPGKTVFYYYCDSVQNTGEYCNLGRFQSKTMDQYIYDNVILGILTAQIRKSNSKKQKEETEIKIQYWKDEIERLNKEKNRSLTLFKKGLIEEDELDKDITRITNNTNNADSEIKRLELVFKDYSTPKGLTHDLMKKYYWSSDFQTRRSLVDEYIQKIVAYKVKHIDFDITQHYSTYYEDAGDGKHINVMKNDNFQKSTGREIIFYVEVFTYLQKEPQRVLMSSISGMNFLSERLNYDIESRTISLGPSKYRVQAK